MNQYLGEQGKDDQPIAEEMWLAALIFEQMMRKILTKRGASEGELLEGERISSFVAEIELETIYGDVAGGMPFGINVPGVGDA